MKAPDIISPGTITETLLNLHLRNKINSGGGGSSLYLNSGDNIIELPLCRTATRENILLDGSVTTVDDITIGQDELCLVNCQDDAKENGVYLTRFSNWVRFEPLRAGMLVCVSEGTQYADTVWQLTSNGNNIGVDNITFEKVLPASNLPSGNENETLRYNASNELEATNRILVYKSFDDDNNNSSAVWLSGYGVNEGLNKWVNSTIEASGSIETGDLYGSITLKVNRQIDETTTKSEILIKSWEDVIQFESLIFRFLNGTDNTDKFLKIKDNTGEIEFSDITGLLPSGTESQTLRHNGTNWVANDLLKIIESIQFGGDIVRKIIEADSFFAEKRVSYGNTLYNIEMAGGYHNFYRYTDNTSEAQLCNSEFKFFEDGANSYASFDYLDNSRIIINNSTGEFDTISDGTSGQALKTDGSGTYSWYDPNKIYKVNADTDASDTTYVDSTMTITAVANVTYELRFVLGFQKLTVAANSVGIKLYSVSNFVYRPFIITNVGNTSAATLVTYDVNAGIPLTMDNSAEITVSLTGDTYHMIELKGIFVPSQSGLYQLQFNSQTPPNGIRLKSYSYSILHR